MKNIILLIICCLLIILSCDNEPTLHTNIKTSVLKGTISLENAAIDTVDVEISLLHTENSDLNYDVSPDSTGFFKIDSLQPGVYDFNIGFNTLFYEDYTSTVEFYIDETVELEPMEFTRIENNAGLEGYVEIDNSGLSIDSVKIDIYYIEDSTPNFAKTIYPDTTGYYETNELFPIQYKLNYKMSGYDDIIQYVTLAVEDTIAMDTVVFEDIIEIPQLNIVVDGDSTDWNEPVYEDNFTSSWGANNELQNFYLARDEDSLYIAVTGGFSDVENCVNIYIDTDFGEGTGLNDFSGIEGGEYGNHLRKTVTCPENFGADIAFSSWALEYQTSVVSLTDELNVDDNILTANFSLNTQVIEFAIPFSEIYEDELSEKIALIVIIGGGGDEFISDDTIPQQDDAHNFENYIKAKY